MRTVLTSVRRRRGWTVAASCLVLALGGAGSAQPQSSQFFTATYDIEDLGTLDGPSYATGINADGQVSGHAFNGSLAQAFLFTPPGPAQYEPPISYGHGVNDLGVLVGDRAIPPLGGGAYQAFRLINNNEQLVPLLAGYLYTQGLSINTWNDVAGDAYNIPDNGRRAYLNTMNGTEDLGTLGGLSSARGVNDRQEVVGYSPPTGYVVLNDPYWEVGHAFYWNRVTGMLDLNAATSGHGTRGVDYFDLTKASAINLHHRIVGYAISWDTNVIRAFMLERTSTPPTFSFENLGTFPGGGISLALAINRGWTAVGAAYLDPSGTGNYRAALFSNGRVVNLNDTLGWFEQGLWRLREATGINDNGEIVGWGESWADNGRHHAFKLTPRAHLEITTAEAAQAGVYLLGVDGAGFMPGGQVQIDVRARDIGGTLIRSGVRTATAGRVTFGARVPCDTNLVVNARDVATEAYSNAVSAYIACQ